MPRADWHFVGGMRITMPPLPEQTAIVRFLDYVDRRVRRVIRARQRLVKLLAEYKQALIHQAVTGRIDVRTGKPYPAYKDSGVEWLGEVPAHWEVRRVKGVAQVFRGKFTHRPRNDPSLYDGPYPFIQTGEVARAEKSITNYRQTLNERGLAVSKMFPSGTLVMTIAANIGDVAVLDFEACFPDSVVGFFPRDAVERDFLYYAFTAMKPELLREAPVNTQGNLNVDRIGDRLIALPPIREQSLVIRAIENETRQLNATVTRARREIDLLKEFRTRLIADVVTGKLDVREVAANLPEEPPEEEPQWSDLEDVSETAAVDDGSVPPGEENSDG
jgi:type I restriction enzyme S subunit